MSHEVVTPHENYRIPPTLSFRTTTPESGRFGGFNFG